MSFKNTISRKSLSSYQKKKEKKEKKSSVASKKRKLSQDEAPRKKKKRNSEELESEEDEDSEDEEKKLYIVEKILKIKNGMALCKWEGYDEPSETDIECVRHLPLYKEFKVTQEVSLEVQQASSPLILDSLPVFNK